MDIKGKWHGNPYYDHSIKKWLITFETSERPNIFDLLKDKVLSIVIKEYSEKRSLNANRLLWECLGKIAAQLRADKWDIYLMMLKRYGQYTYVCVPPEAVEKTKKQWRECEELGLIDINGRPAMQLICYFGSSTYDKKEFSVLLDGVISEMKEMGIQTPSEREFDEVMKSWKVS